MSAISNGIGNGNGGSKDTWKSIALFLAGVVLSLISTYVVNGASKQDIVSAMAVQEKYFAVQITAMSYQVQNLSERMQKLQDKVDSVSLAVGVDGNEPRKRR